ncbi:MAG: diaminopimelate decarboxylase, partial [Flavobacteriia bacterium]|nr:diaminopimelate decarboxylase [Flavobacteriia bacterium]
MTNQDLLKIAQDYGSPVYVYDAEKITSQYKRLDSAFKKVKQVKFN